MSEHFHIFGKAVEARFKAMSEGELYTVDAENLFDTYLAAFPEGTNPIFRVRTEHDCACCRHFVKNLGKVVSLEGGEITTVWDNLADLPAPYDSVAEAMGEHIRSLPIKTIFRTKESQFGNPATIELGDAGIARTWHHFSGRVVRHRSNRPEEDRGQIVTNVGVFRRGLEELAAWAIEDVIDLIDANGLYRGAEFRHAVAAFGVLHRAYRQFGSALEKEIFVWLNVGHPAALFRNTVIGTLVVDLSAGEELDKAVRMFEAKVAPTNYKRPTAVITPRMIEDAVEKLKDLGLESAVERRFARLEDVSVNNVLFVDNSVKLQMKDGITGLLMKEVKPAKVDIAHATDISMDDFLETVVPQASTIEVLLKSQHLSNLMSVTAPVHPDAGKLFKWSNGFAWSYDGDAADSIKQKVKRAGGNVEADLRVSLAWSNFDDLDLHVWEPNGNEISYHNKCGKLDVDMNAGSGTTREPVENVCWVGSGQTRLVDGRYRVGVHQYSKRESIDVGFALEVECGGIVQQFTYDRAVVGLVGCLELTIKGGALIELKSVKELVSGSASQDKWGVKSETLVPVNTLMASPNHWDGEGVGNKHWFFILKDCINPAPARGIYNEFLKGELDPHRKVFEVLGAKSKCPVAAEQLSGVGFSSTRHDKATVVVKGERINKAFNINF